MSVPVAIKNIAIEGSATLPYPYNGVIPVGETIVVSDTDVPTVVANLGGVAQIAGSLNVFLAPPGSAITPNSSGPGGVMTLSASQTVTGAKTFNTDTLKVKSASGSHLAKFENAGTADRTITLPDASVTLASKSIATAAEVNSAAMAKTISGATVSWATNVATISAGGAVVAAHALAGGRLNDGTGAATILDNSALTATTGTITVEPVPTPPTGVTVDAYSPAVHTHIQS